MEDIKYTRAERLADEDIDIATIGDEDYVTPSAGGCWVCNKRHGEMEFDQEFDTWYHPECLEQLGVGSVLEYEREY